VTHPPFVNSPSLASLSNDLLARQKIAGLEPAAAVDDKRRCPEEQNADGPKEVLTARRICGFHRVRPRPPYWFCDNGSMSTAIEKTHIEITPGICGGRPRIAGHRIRVQDIVRWTEESLSPDEIVVRFPQLSLADAKHRTLTNRSPVRWASVPRHLACEENRGWGCQIPANWVQQHKRRRQGISPILDRARA